MGWRIDGGRVGQWVRGVLLSALVLVMAAVSAGAVGAPAWATTGEPQIAFNQIDNHSSPDNDDPVPSPPGETIVTGLTCPGAARISVGSLVGFSAGSKVRINSGGPTQEDAQVVDVGCGGKFLHLAGPLRFRHQFGEAVVVVAQGQAATTVNPPNNDAGRERTESQRRTEQQRQQSEQTNRSGRDDVHSEGDVSAVDLSKQPPEITILTRDGPQIVQLLCGGQCPAVKVGDYVEVDGAKQHEGLFTADTVTVTRR